MSNMHIHRIFPCAPAFARKGISYLTAMYTKTVYIDKFETPIMCHKVYSGSREKIEMLIVNLVKSCTRYNITNIGVFKNENTAIR